MLPKPGQKKIHNKKTSQKKKAGTITIKIKKIV